MPYSDPRTPQIAFPVYGRTTARLVHAIKSLSRRLVRATPHSKTEWSSRREEYDSTAITITDPILEILKEYPKHGWKFRFSEARVKSQWALRASGTCINPKGAMVTFEIFAPPVEAIHESGFVKVTVDTICVYRRIWDGYRLGPQKSVREEVLRSPYWQWIEPRYQANLFILEDVKRGELAFEDAQERFLYDQALEKL